MEFELTHRQKMLRDSIREIVERELPREYLRELDEKGEFPYKFYEKLAELGYFGLIYPKEYGGAEAGSMDLIIVGEELGRYCLDIGSGYETTMFSGLAILHHGTEGQKRYYIPRIIGGTQRFSLSITEPDAGSDAASIRTMAIQDGEYYVLNGQKVFASLAHLENNIIVLYARTDDKVDTKHKGITAFLLDPKNKGVMIRRLNTLGRRIGGANEIFLTDVRIPKENILGKLNEGWSVLVGELDLERLFACSQYVGNTQTIVSDALDYAKKRVQFGRPIGSFQSIAHMIVNLQTEVEAARLLIYRAAWMYQKGLPCSKEISMAKLFVSELAVRAANAGMQVMGGYGYVMDSDMQRFFRDTRILTIVAGTSQIQRNIIARHLGLKVT